MADLEHDGSALATVRAFLAQHETSSSEDEAPVEKFTPRPARLGVGADPNQSIQATTTPGLSEANRRLGSALRRQARQLQKDSDESDGSDSEIESKARAVGKREHAASTVADKTKNGVKISNKSTRNQIENGEKGKQDKHGSSSDEEWGDDVLRKMEEKECEFQSWSSSFVSVDNTGRDTHNGGVVNSDGQVRKKRKKIRSRQKNLKRDKRKRHELPSHLTEETLKAGRVRKSADGSWRFEASSGSGRKE